MPFKCSSGRESNQALLLLSSQIPYQMIFPSCSHRLVKRLRCMPVTYWILFHDNSLFRGFPMILRECSYLQMFQPLIGTERIAVYSTNWVVRQIPEQYRINQSINQSISQSVRQSISFKIVLTLFYYFIFWHLNDFFTNRFISCYYAVIMLCL